MKVIGIKQMWRLLKEGEKHDLQMLILQFELAVTTCHEATHAVRYASSSRYKLQMRVFWNDSRKMTWRLDVTEPYFEDHWQAELGHAWEQEVLGGRIQGWIPSDGEELIIPTVSAWPDRANLNHEYGGFKYSQRGILPPSGPDPDYYEDCYPASCRYIHEVQQQRFWNGFWGSIEREHCMGLHIRVPKLIGYRQRWVSASSIPLQSFSDEVGGVELMLQAMQDQLEGRDEVVMRQERIVYWNPAPRMISYVAFSDQASDPEATKRAFSELPFLRQPLDLDRSEILSSKFSRLLALDLAGWERSSSNLSSLLAIFPKDFLADHLPQCLASSYPWDEEDLQCQL